MKVKSLSRVRLSDPWTATCQAPPSMGFSRQEYWSGLPLPSPQQVYKVVLIFHVFSRWGKWVFVVQSLNCVWPFMTLWTAANLAFLSFTISWNLLKLKSTESMMPSNHLVLKNEYTEWIKFPQDHQWLVVGLEFGSKQFSSEVYILNDINITKNWLVKSSGFPSPDS